MKGLWSILSRRASAGDSLACAKDGYMVFFWEFMSDEASWNDIHFGVCWLDASPVGAFPLFLSSPASYSICWHLH
jgi:hypothetical protein